jgi:hypothetical protein
MTRSSEGGRRLMPALAGLIALAAMIAVLAVSGASEGHADTQHGYGHGHAAAPAATTTRQAAFHDAMRKLWEDHITWTRLAIVSFAGDLPDLPATEQRLLRNQTDIGDAIKPFYGKAAGDRLTKLLKAHITGAVDLLSAAKSGTPTDLARAKAAWYANGRQVADFLHSANPQHWGRADMRSMMKTHLDQTLAEGVDQLQGRYAAGVREYDAVHVHILAMADELASGIAAQFPSRF